MKERALFMWCLVAVALCFALSIAQLLLRMYGSIDPNAAF